MSIVEAGTKKLTSVDGSLTGPPANLAWLRLLCTTDLHAELRDFDYARNRRDPTKGLSRAGGVIQALREEGHPSILVDNGDFLFGLPFADLADAGAGAVVEAMTALGYDAVNPGNHELDHGYQRFRQAVAGSALPVVSASLVGREGQSVFPATRLVERSVLLRPGVEATVLIGIVGILPPRCVTAPERLEDEGIRIRDPEDAARAAVRGLQAMGADVIVLLCHEGLSDRPREDLALRLAQLPGVDAMVLGHVHETFPRSGRTAIEGIDWLRGTVHGVPTVMPGFWGNHVGRIDLGLSHDGARFRVAQSRVALHAIASREGQSVAGAPTVLRASQKAHAETLKLQQEPVVETSCSLYSFFAQIGYCPATGLGAAAIAAAVRRSLPEGGAAHPPVVGLAAPVMCGGFRGPGDYVDIQPGALSRGDIRRLAPHGDLVIGLPATGGDLRLWLERSMSAFHRVLPGEHAMALIDPAFPPADFDLPDAVTYKVDLRHPAMFTARGLATGASPGRVRDLCLNGAPLADDDPVVIATTTHRGGGGGRFPVPSGGPTILTGTSIGEAIVAALEVGMCPDSFHPFDFTLVPHATALFSTGPRATAFLPVLERPGITSFGIGRDGFLKLLLRLDAG